MSLAGSDVAAVQRAASRQSGVLKGGLGDLSGGPSRARLLAAYQSFLKLMSATAFELWTHSTLHEHSTLYERWICKV